MGIKREMGGRKMEMETGREDEDDDRGDKNRKR